MAAPHASRSRRQGTRSWLLTSTQARPHPARLHPSSATAHASVNVCAVSAGDCVSFSRSMADGLQYNFFVVVPEGFAAGSAFVSECTLAPPQWAMDWLSPQPQVLAVPIESATTTTTAVPTHPSQGGVEEVE